MPVTIRTPRSGDGTGMARVWLSAAAYYAGLDARHFQIPSADGVAESSVPFYERHMGYRRRAIVFQKPL